MLKLIVIPCDGISLRITFVRVKDPIICCGINWLSASGNLLYYLVLCVLIVEAASSICISFNYSTLSMEISCALYDYLL